MKRIYTLLIALAIISITSPSTNAQGGGGATQLQVSPNPAHDFVKILWQQQKSGNIEIRLYNMSGTVACILTSNYYYEGNHNETFKFPGLRRGTYTLKLLLPGQILTQTIIIG